MSEPKMFSVDLHQFIGFGLTVGYCKIWDGFVICLCLPYVTLHLETRRKFGLRIKNNRV